MKYARLSFVMFGLCLIYTSCSQNFLLVQDSFKTTLSNTQTPNYRKLIHGVHPGSSDGDETKVDDLPRYQTAVGENTPGGISPRKAAFVYISQELDEPWLYGNNNVPVFPEQQVRAIYNNGSIPFIRLMTRTSTKINKGKNNEDLYTYEVILDERDTTLKDKVEIDKANNARQAFRNRIQAWGAVAARLSQEFHKPLYIEWGTEVNGKWFWWNAFWHNKKWCDKIRKENKERCFEAGVDKFRQSFIKIRSLVNQSTPNSDLRWVFHPASGSDPNPLKDGNAWNAIDKYYPDTDYVNAVGVSVYGSQAAEDSCETFEQQMNKLFPDSSSSSFNTFKDIGKSKDVFILELGTNLIDKNSNKLGSPCNAENWTSQALNKLFDAGYLSEYRIVGFSWWNEAWGGDDDPIIDMRLQEAAQCHSKLDKEMCKQLNEARRKVRNTFVSKFNERKDFVLGQMP